MTIHHLTSSAETTTLLSHYGLCIFKLKVHWLETDTTVTYHKIDMNDETSTEARTTRTVKDFAIHETPTKSKLAMEYAHPRGEERSEARKPR